MLEEVSLAVGSASQITGPSTGGSETSGIGNQETAKRPQDAGGSPKAEDHEFTLAEWETLLRELRNFHEARKLEYTRWIVGGLTVTAILLALFFDRLPLVDLGPHPVWSFIVFWLVIYLGVRCFWELFRETIGSILSTVISSSESPASETIRPILDLGQPKLAEVAFSHLATGLSITTFLLLLSFWPLHTTQPGELRVLAIMRLVAVYLLALAMFLYHGMGERSVAARINRYIERIRPEHRPALAKGVLLGKYASQATGVIYYLVQLWLLWPVFASTIPFTWDVFQVFALGAAALGLIVWVRDQPWALVEESSERVRVLSTVYESVLMGKVIGSAEIRRLLSTSMEPPESTRANASGPGSDEVGSREG